MKTDLLKEKLEELLKTPDRSRVQIAMMTTIIEHAQSTAEPPHLVKIRRVGWAIHLLALAVVTASIFSGGGAETSTVVMVAIALSVATNIVHHLIWRSWANKAIAELKELATPASRRQVAYWIAIAKRSPDVAEEISAEELETGIRSTPRHAQEEVLRRLGAFLLDPPQVEDPDSPARQEDWARLTETLYRVRHQE